MPAPEPLDHETHAMKHVLLVTAAFILLRLLPAEQHAWARFS
ncbi:MULTISPECIES: hypothetical protein [unclassified Pseudomonas]|nr:MULTISPECIES: hypothetical protein [unclassified Pseudomonas]